MREKTSTTEPSKAAQNVHKLFKVKQGSLDQQLRITVMVSAFVKKKKFLVGANEAVTVAERKGALGLSEPTVQSVCFLFAS